jgi:hypothetical protein
LVAIDDALAGAVRESGERMASGLARALLSSLHVTAEPGAVSAFVVSAHQATIDVPVAVEVTRRLGFRFATWAHPEVVSRLPMLKRAGFMAAASEPERFGRLVKQTRETLRHTATPTLLWVFPEGQFSHFMNPPDVQRGVLAAFRACAEVPILGAGFHYTVFRKARPHCTMVLRPAGAIRTQEALTMLLTERRAEAVERSRVELPARIPALGTSRRRSLGWFHATNSQGVRLSAGRRR